MVVASDELIPGARLSRRVYRATALIEYAHTTARVGDDRRADWTNTVPNPP